MGLRGYIHRQSCCCLTGLGLGLNVLVLFLSLIRSEDVLVGTDDGQKGGNYRGCLGGYGFRFCIEINGSYQQAPGHTHL